MSGQRKNPAGGAARGPLRYVASRVVHLIGPGTLKVVNDRLAFTTRKNEPLRIDADAVRQVVCHGRVGLSDAAVGRLLDRRVNVAWVSDREGHLGSLEPAGLSSGARLRRAQHAAAADPAACLHIAKGIVLDKLRAQAATARRGQRSGWPAGGVFLRQSDGWRREIERAANLDRLRGFEAQAAVSAWAAFGERVAAPFEFRGRRRRPPPDPVNALLSLGATLLTRRVAARLGAAGWEVTLGFLHAIRPGRPSLACDAVEPLRPTFVEGWALSLVGDRRLRWMSPSSFAADGAGGVRVAKEPLARVIASWETWAEAHGLEPAAAEADARLRLGVAGRDHAANGGG